MNLLYHLYNTLYSRMILSKNDNTGLMQTDYDELINIFFIYSLKCKHITHFITDTENNLDMIYQLLERKNKIAIDFQNKSCNDVDSIVHDTLQTSIYTYIPCDTEEINSDYKDKIYSKKIDSISNMDIDYTCRKGDTLFENIDQTDFLYIDTYKVYGQLRRELEKHCNNVNKYILIKDTYLYQFVGEYVYKKLDLEKKSKNMNWEYNDVFRGLLPAIEDFLQDHPEFRIIEYSDNKNGFILLERYQVNDISFVIENYNKHKDVSMDLVYTYASKCTHVTDISTRHNNYIWAIVYGLLNNNSDIKYIRTITNNAIFRKILTVENEKLEWNNTDVLFIDNSYVYGQLTHDLNKYYTKVKKYIIIVGTYKYKYIGEVVQKSMDIEDTRKKKGFSYDEIFKGIFPAIENFITHHPEFRIKHIIDENDGIIIIEKI